MKLLRTPVELLSRHRPLLGCAENFLERVRCFFAADGEEDAGGDNGGLGVAIDVDALALEAFALLAFESVLCVGIFDNLIVDNCLALVDLSVVRLCERDDGDGEGQVAPLLFDDAEALSAWGYRRAWDSRKRDQRPGQRL